MFSSSWFAHQEAPKRRSQSVCRGCENTEPSIDVAPVLIGLDRSLRVIRRSGESESDVRRHANRPAAAVQVRRTRQDWRRHPLASTSSVSPHPFDHSKACTVDLANPDQRPSFQTHEQTKQQKQPSSFLCRLVSQALIVALSRARVRSGQDLWTRTFQQRLSDLIGPYRGTYRIGYRVLQPLLVGVGRPSPPPPPHHRSLTTTAHGTAGRADLWTGATGGS